MSTHHSILVLGGGPDSEREVSLMSSKGVAEALAAKGHRVNYQIIDRLTRESLRALSGDIIFPVLHGGWGEGGPLQDLMALDGRPFVGCHAPAARIAMDKMATKLYAAKLGIPTAPAVVINPADTLGIALAAPMVFKPVHEGSSVGLHICRDEGAKQAAFELVKDDIAAHPSRIYMAEAAISNGRELTVPIVGDGPLDPIEIRPAQGVYDYQAKYFRDDTQYIVAPELPGDTTQRIQRDALSIFKAINARHIARVDFIFSPADGTAYLLEVNTMPGFTSHSLVPKAAKHAGMDYATLCERLVQMALA